MLLVLGTAVAVAVAYRVRERSRVAAQQLGGGWAPYRVPTTTTPPSEAGPSAAEPAEEAPTAAPATVVATMEATPVGPVARPFDGNGSVVAGPVGAPAGDGSAETTARPEHVVSPVALPKRRTSGVTLAALAALTGVGAITLGAWGIATSVADDNGGTETPAALENVQQVVSLIAKPTTATIPLQGSGRRIILVVGARGYGVLVLNGVSQPPVGKTYQAWVIRPNVKAPASAGIFPGGTGVVQLTKPVPPGAVVAITVEPAGGSVAPTQQPKLVATRT